MLKLLQDKRTLKWKGFIIGKTPLFVHYKIMWLNGEKEMLSSEYISRFYNIKDI